MREALNNQQIVCPEDATRFVYAIFPSDCEMMTSYFTLNCFINPSNYLVGRPDRQRLEDLESVFSGNVATFEAAHRLKKISVKDVIKGFGMHMMNVQVLNANRMQSANVVGSFTDCIIDTIKDNWQYKQMYQVSHLHPESARYSLNRLNGE